jgi:hypothetical protein
VLLEFNDTPTNTFDRIDELAYGYGAYGDNPGLGVHSGGADPYVPYAGNSIYFEAIKSGDNYTGGYSTDDVNWTLGTTFYDTDPLSGLGIFAINRDDYSSSDATYNPTSQFMEIVPEPGSMALLVLGVVIFAGNRRRMKF